MIRIAIVCTLALVACKKDTAKTEPTKTEPTKADPKAATVPSDGTRFEVKVTDKGFEPDDINVPAGKPVTIVFERKTDQTCAKEVIINMADGSKIEKQLPLNTPVEVAATFPSAGKLGYACGMDMIKGTITVQ